MNFNNFNLHPQILKAITASGYTEPTGIQIEAIPKIMNGVDIRASAQTGTGKTGAFLLPALNLLNAPPKTKGKGARILIIVPTRELAMQVATQSKKYSKFLKRVKTVCVVGGVPYRTQMRDLSRPYDILIATPGRLIDYIHQKKIDFSRLEMMVLDEADRMLDMGFVEPVEEIAAATPSDRQTLLFSATLQGSVMKLSQRLLNQPEDIVIHAEHAKHENITQSLHYVDNVKHKKRLLDHLLNEDEVKSTIIFTSTKRNADQLVDNLCDQGHSVAALHGDMNQGRRNRTIAQLRSGKIKTLVATDVAARGIDVQHITHVINFDLPQNIEDYVHRIGRTGRAGAKGTALSFVDGRDFSLVRRIEKFTGQKIDPIVVEGFEPNTKPTESPANKGRPGSNRGPQRRFKAKGGARKGKGAPRKSNSSTRSKSAKGKFTRRRNSI